MKQSAVLLLIFTLTLVSCDDMGTYRQPVPPEVAIALAQVTDEAGSVAMQSDRLERESEQATKNAETDMTATHGAYIATATQSAIATKSAIAAATATTSAFNREQIELEALTIRRRAETAATIESIAIETTREYNKQQREEWSRDVGAGILLALFLLIGSGLGMLAWREAWTLRDKNGEVIGYRGEIFLPENEPIIIEQPLPALESPRSFAVRNRGGFVAVEETRKPFDLTGRDGSLVTKFTSRILDDMQTNVENGDRGFRRDSSANKLGMDKLAGLNGNGYKNVLDAMRVHGFVELDGGNNRWTTHGVVTVLGMDSITQS